MKIAGAAILLFFAAIAYYYFSSDECDTCKNFHARNKDHTWSGKTNFQKEEEEKDQWSEDEDLQKVHKGQPETIAPPHFRPPSSVQQDHGGLQKPVLTLSPHQDTGHKWSANDDDFQKLHEAKGHKWPGNDDLQKEQKDNGQPIINIAPPPFRPPPPPSEHQEGLQIPDALPSTPGQDTNVNDDYENPKEQPPPKSDDVDEDAQSEKDFYGNEDLPEITVLNTSTCTKPWSGFENPGAGGSAFFKSADDQFVLKTVHDEEAVVLQNLLLAGYYLNLNQNPDTLLPKFMGLYYYTGGWMKKMRLVVMNNLLPSAIKFHQIYDLKGSTHNRFASVKERNKTSPILKDLDFMDDHPQGIYLKPAMYETLVRAIQRDSRVLENFEIMDYSLLLGIHYLDAPRKETHGGIPARRADGAHLLLFIGIIDILQTYDAKKKLTHAVKEVYLDGDKVSVHRPDFYGSRFRNFTMQKVFKKEPSADVVENAELHNDENLPEIILPKNPTSRTTAGIQLGIAVTTKSLVTKPRQDLLMQDYPVVESAYFPMEGTEKTPPHTYHSFQFDTYASLAFYHFRAFYNLTTDKFLLSLCTKPWIVFANPALSGSALYISGDYQFVLKSVQEKEAELLQQKLFAGYYMNWNQNPDSLLPKFSGLYYYKRSWRKQMRLIVMNNILPSEFQMHEKYDLKGSRHERHASKKEKKKKTPTLKDLDFLENHPQGIFLDPDVYDALERTLKRDCLVLENFEIMDYSLLLGIHYLDGPPQKEATGGVKVRSGGVESNSSSASGPEPSILETPQENPAETNVTDPKAGVNTLIRARRGVSTNNELDKERWHGGILTHSAAGDRLLIFFGIIDILQTYGMFKQAEHAWKDVVYGGDIIDVHRPDFYSSRFQSFMMTKVFQRLPSCITPSSACGS